MSGKKSGRDANDGGSRMGTDLERSLSAIAFLGGIERILLVSVVLYGFWWALRRASLDAHTKLITGWGITITLISWLSAVWVFALSGAEQMFARTSLGAAIALIVAPII